MFVYRNFSIFIFSLIFLYYGISDVKSMAIEKRGLSSTQESNDFDLIRTLFYPNYKRTTIEEQSQPIIKYVLSIPLVSRDDNLRKPKQILERSPRRKRSIGFGYSSLSNPLSPLTYGGSGTYGAYSGYGSPLGYGYNYPYGYGSGYGGYGGSYGYGSGYGNYGYGYGTGYGTGYYDPNCDYY